PWASQERVCSRPTTTTRLPRVSDSATFSPSVRQPFTVKYDVSPSFHWPDWSWYLRFTATLNLTTAAPFGVYRSSGSSVRFPTMTTWFMLAIPNHHLLDRSAPPGRWLRPDEEGEGPFATLRRPHPDLVPDDLVGQGQ